MNVPRDLPEYFDTDTEHAPNIVSHSSRDPSQYLPAFALRVSREPVLHAITLEADVNAKRPVYSCKLTWYDRTSAPAKEWTALNDQKTVDVLVAPLAQCNGPCSLSFPSTQLVEFGRCEHYVCTKCIKNSANPESCPNKECVLLNYISDSGSKASRSAKPSRSRSVDSLFGQLHKDPTELMSVNIYLIKKSGDKKYMRSRRTVEIPSKSKLSNVFDFLQSIAKSSPERISYVPGTSSRLKDMTAIDLKSIDGQNLISTLAGPDENTISFGIEL